MMQILLVLTVVILIVTGQILWKLGAGNNIHDFGSFLAAIINPYVIIGAIIYVIAAVAWIFVLSKYQYHHVYPLMSLSFVFALLASHFILHEQVSWLSWLGVGVILLGVVIIGFANK